MKGRRVGPYRLYERIGRGGMGEVFRGFDGRLDRWVALKQVRPDRASDPARRLRLRREAKAAAALDHPAIVRVYDLLEEPGGDWIVMELVDGVALTRLLEECPPTLAEGLTIARQLAKGLAAAHRAGFVHRDLKADNVIVTPDGQPKILDFGIARRFSSQLTGSDVEGGLTEDGRLIGTPHAMSPEQARGRPADPRSDLFSLGVLLYELFGRRSPFRSATRGATLERLTTYSPLPLIAENRRVPRALSDFVDRLLEKNPARRPASADEAVAILGSLAGEARAGTDRAEPLLLGLGDESVVGEGTTAATRYEGEDGAEERSEPAASPSNALAESSTYAPAPAFRSWRSGVAAGLLLAGLAIVAGIVGSRTPEWLYVGVALPNIEVQPSADAAPLLEDAVQTALFEGLLSLQGVAALSADEMDDPPIAATELAEALAAQEILSVDLKCRLPACQVRLRRLQGADGRVLWQQVFEAPADDLQLLATGIVARLHRAYVDRSVRSGASNGRASREDYERFLRLRRDHRKRARPSAELLEHLADLRRDAPRFVEVYLLEAAIAHRQYFYSRRPGELERALELLSSARRLAPENAMVLHRVFGVALDGGRLALAAQVVRELERLEPGDLLVSSRRALLFERQGHRREALRLMRTYAERRSSRSALYSLADMEVRLGEEEAARRTLDTLLQRSPRDLRGLSLLAQIELVGGSAERAEGLYRELLQLEEGAGIRANLGLAQMLAGRFEAAEESLQRAHELAPANPVIALNLADARNLAGEVGPARELYQQVVDLSPTTESATDWQSLTVAGQALAHLGRDHEAVVAIHKALRLAPGHPQAAFEAAVVYAVVGERASALVAMETAVGGLNRRWFALPWFDTLRNDPAFSAQLNG